MELYAARAAGTNPTKVSRPLTGTEPVQNDFFWGGDSGNLFYRADGRVIEVAVEGMARIEDGVAGGVGGDVDDHWVGLSYSCANSDEGSLLVLVWRDKTTGKWVMEADDMRVQVGIAEVSWQ